MNNKMSIKEVKKLFKTSISEHYTNDKIYISVQDIDYIWVQIPFNIKINGNTLIFEYDPSDKREFPEMKLDQFIWEIQKQHKKWKDINDIQLEINGQKLELIRLKDVSSYVNLDLDLAFQFEGIDEILNNDKLNETLTSSDPKARDKFNMIYITKNNPCFRQKVRKIGYSTISFNDKIFKLNTSVPFSYEPFAAIIIKSKKYTENDLYDLEQEFHDQLLNHNLKYNSGSELYKMSDEVCERESEQFIDNILKNPEQYSLNKKDIEFYKFK